MRRHKNQGRHNAASYWLTTYRIPVSKRPNNFQRLVRQAICFSPVSHHTLPPVITSDMNRSHHKNNAYCFTGNLPNCVDFFCDIRLFLIKSGRLGRQELGVMEHLPYSRHPRVDLSNGVLTQGRVMLLPFAENYYFNWNVWLFAINRFWIFEANKRKTLFLSFRRVLNVIYSFLGNSPASEF